MSRFRDLAPMLYGHQVDSVVRRGWAGLPAVRQRARLGRQYGAGRWQKRKGVAAVRLQDGTIHRAEVHWFEAHGVGRQEMKIKFPLLD